MISGAFGALTASLVGCARDEAPSLLRLHTGRDLVLGPTPEFDPARLPGGWSVLGEDRAARPIVTRIADRPVLTMRTPGGTMLIRRLDGYGALRASPFVGWSWALESDIFGSGGGDGLARGLVVTLGTRGGIPRGLIDPGGWLRSYRGYPPHDRRIAVEFAGVAAARPELASVALAAVADGGPRRMIREAQRGQIGGWLTEFIDFAELYRQFWPQDRFADVQYAFLAVGALPARSGLTAPSTIGHIVELQVSR
jgi:hypothetical protein